MTDLANQVEFMTNAEARCACCLILDTSGSMAGAPIEALNAGIAQFQSETAQDALASLRTEVAVLTFNDSVQLVQDFVTVNQFQAPRLVAEGTTSLAAAVREGMRLLAERKETYHKNGIAQYRPWLMLITDGAPTDAPEIVELARQELEAAREQLSFYAIGVEGADMEFLRRLSGPQRTPLRLKGLQFREFFRWLSISMRRVSQSRVGDKVPLPPVGWSEA